MKVLMVSLFSINTPHFETELEIMQRHLDSGDEVQMMWCRADLMTCDVNIGHDALTCLTCIGRLRSGVRLLSAPVTAKPFYYLKPHDREELGAVRREFFGLKDLREYHVDNLDIGQGVLSSLISATRNSEPDTSSRQISVAIYRYVPSMLALYRTVINYLDAEHFDRVYVYNGRYAPARAVLRACQLKAVDCFTHERGSSLQRYALYRNTSPHDLDYLSNDIAKAWSVADPDKRDSIASQFFDERAAGVSRTWHAFTKDQRENMLPDDWDDNRTNIAIFVSSEDEFAAIDDTWKNPLYANQLDGLRKILASVGNDARLKLYLRIHPNLIGIKNKQTAELDKLKADNLIIIPADSPISSYALMKRASKVLTFGSTVGIEAVYWGIPSILAGQSLYRRLGCTYNPGDHAGLVQLLFEDLPAMDKEGALMYGYYLLTFGIPFQDYESTGILEGKFKSVTVEPSRGMAGAIRWLRRLDRFIPVITMANKLSDFRSSRFLRKGSRPA